MPVMTPFVAWPRWKRDHIRLIRETRTPAKENGLLCAPVKSEIPTLNRPNRRSMKTAGKMVCATVAFALLHSALASRAAKQAAAGIAGERRAHAGYRRFLLG